MTIQSIALLAHVLVSFAIILLVLLQRGKGADAGAAFGSGASGTVFGAKGSANFLSRSTAVLATVFYLSSLGLTYMAANRPVSRSLMDAPQTPAIEVSSSQLSEEESAATIEALPTLPELVEPGEQELPSEPGAK